MTKDRNILRKIGIGAAVVVFFLALSYSFVPQVLGGKIVNQSDIYGYVGMSHEMTTHNAAHPEDPTAWTNSMFGGMPTTTISAPRQGDWTQPIYDLLLTGKRPATYLFISLIGAFLLMLSLGVNWIVAIGGAIAVTFCAYNFQIIQVGHNTKMQAIAFLPWVLAAFVYTFKLAFSDRKWLPKTVFCSVLFALALSFQVKANHQQITYYLAILIFLYAIILLISILSDPDRKRKLGRFFASAAILLVVGLIGIATNTIKLAPVWEYSKFSTRGGTELQEDAASASNNSGLNINYATAWSYGWEELPNLMIPNFNGGSSAEAANPSKSETVKLLRANKQPNLNQIAKNLPLYWGPQPFTAGPMYMGAITIFLFLLGLMVCRGKEKWWIVVSTLIAVFLGVGSHFMWFTRLWFDYMPLYNKFRTVSMALVLLQFTLPMLAFIALDKIFKGDYDKKQIRSKAITAYAIAGGFCLLFALLPDLAGSFSGRSDQGQQQILVDALVADRRSMLVKDAWISFAFISTAFILLILSLPSEKSGKSSRMAAVIGICVLVLVNMFAVGKRYLNNDDFITPRNFNGQFAQRPVDKIILEDKDLSYRVIDFTIDMFNDARSAYWHKEIAGYSPAKLQRYQDLIEHYIANEINSVLGAAKGSQTITEVQEKIPYAPVMSMLNCRYFIFGGDNPPAINPYAFGNAWFVDNYKPADTPDDEIDLLGETDLGHIAVIGDDFKQFRDRISGSSPDPGDTVYMTSYSANELHYHYKVSSPRAVLFSEVYYPDGWHAWVQDGDASGKSAARGGNPVEVFRADWILRGVILPEGEHDLVMRFDPTVYRFGSHVSRASSVTLILLLLLSSAVLIVSRKKEESD